MRSNAAPIQSLMGMGCILSLPREVTTRSAREPLSRGSRHPIEQQCQHEYPEGCDESLASIERGESLKDLGAKPGGTDEGRDHYHRQRHHDALVDPQHDGSNG